MRESDEVIREDFEQKPERKPYKKPNILSTELLETVAAACDPFTGGKTPEEFCDSNNLQS